MFFFQTLMWPFVLTVLDHPDLTQETGITKRTDGDPSTSLVLYQVEKHWVINLDKQVSVSSIYRRVVMTRVTIFKGSTRLSKKVRK